MCLLLHTALLAYPQASLHMIFLSTSYGPPIGQLQVEIGKVPVYYLTVGWCQC